MRGRAFKKMLQVRKAGHRDTRLPKLWLVGKRRDRHIPAIARSRDTDPLRIHRERACQISMDCFHVLEAIVPLFLVIERHEGLPKPTASSDIRGKDEEPVASQCFQERIVGRADLARWAAVYINDSGFGSPIWFVEETVERTAVEGWNRDMGRGWGVDAKRKTMAVGVHEALVVVQDGGDFIGTEIPEMKGRRGLRGSVSECQASAVVGPLWVEDESVGFWATFLFFKGRRIADGSETKTTFIGQNEDLPRWLVELGKLDIHFKTQTKRDSFGLEVEFIDREEFPFKVGEEEQMPLICPHRGEEFGLFFRFFHGKGFEFVGVPVEEPPARVASRYALAQEEDVPRRGETDGLAPARWRGELRESPASARDDNGLHIGRPVDEETGRNPLSIRRPFSAPQFMFAFEKRK